ncbi:hypothetical protein RBI13_18705 [Alcaligenaceae bacterium A4P071]|nr:hypothetical protein [Alcaligenaceae bacterium A4P071]
MKNSKQASPSSDEQPKIATRSRGFAVVAPKKLARISSQGGTTAHAMGLAHEFTPTTAREAALKRWSKVKTSSDGPL